ncbi:gamma-glutamyltransferase family protein [Pseudooctadecabacter jejudonensis]|uniref:Putative gamma-glutamyltransferase YwrD n=1 Tax=Pseudooctadecabacter jejudonensis TaxID=1391910 RepID=A0A1Y5SA75_9RHOB|nr:gamma-glutamyltransferase family protein [Pseudooctadecabacter jejudonensis]SLN35770.1 Putative gamma-glutamyltransferase YwrD [Pseudooctadecabacter jejudonensis]
MRDFQSRDFQSPGRSAVIAQNGICATSHPLAAKVAVQILEAGGNAMDAAIAGAILLGLCEPQSTGIGGDAFCLFNLPGSDDVHAMNASGRAPAGLDAAKLRAEGLDVLPLTSPHAISLPGAMDGFIRLAKDHGKIGLKAILAPSIHYAEAGIPVAPKVAFDYAQSGATLWGAGRRHYTLQDTPLTVGQMFRAPGQAEVLRRVAMDGREGFYEGEVAEDMVASLNAAGATHTLDDFAAVRADYTDPISGTYKDIELVEHPPNGQGATAILMLNILKHFDIAGLDPMGADRAHLEAEAAKLAYDTRNRVIADPDHTARLDHMLSPETAAKLAEMIDPNAAIPPSLPGAEAVHRDTVYITVVDKDRMCVSMIYSIFHSFGSGLASDKFGILFQNRAAGFTLEEGHPNEAGGGKRPMHTIIPGMVKRAGKIEMPFGVMGGAYQPCGHARFLTNMEDFGMDPQTAIDRPRCFAEGDTLNVETGYSEAVAQALADKGHTVTRAETPIGGAQAIRLRPDGMLEGASDPRKDGIALGY